MWIPWHDDEAVKAEKALRDAGLPVLADAIKNELEFRQTPAATELGEKVIDLYGQVNDGDLDVDDKVAISPSDDGAYVLCWLWLSNEQMNPTPQPINP